MTMTAVGDDRMILTAGELLLMHHLHHVLCSVIIIIIIIPGHIGCSYNWDEVLDYGV